MKRSRSDSVTDAVQAMVNAAKEPLCPPAHVPLTEDEMLFWNGIICARARDEWQEVDLVVAAQLAQCQASIKVETDALRDEGSVLVNHRGTQIANPRHSVVQQLAQREMALMRTLRMGGRVAGDARDEIGKRALERDARKVRSEILDDEESLLAS